MRHKTQNNRQYCPGRKKSKTAYDMSIRSYVRVAPRGHPSRNVKTSNTLVGLAGCFA